MLYTIGEIAKLLDMPTSTLKFYDKEGLLPFVERSSGGMRVFKTSDYEFSINSIFGRRFYDRKRRNFCLCKGKI
ncbi:MerR family DNA-binding transcriptional regulator [Clostridium estertheticum]|uniref:MerR family DNA-binding transcriptional regulator n=1 Tax=Clostridium estertheticum TaxID=238834 RepID=UPI001C0E62FB|nr:MerR family DNA-binding transcriptional regulator [Clostridium estertheticum]MBU3178490.1 MerR family DNA-binding transcriptional regulator [Clostridium estertheticum]